MTQNQNTLQAKTKSLAIWTFAWVISTAIAAFGPKFFWNEMISLSIASIVLNIAVGIKMILANMHHLNTLDELQRRIQLEAMAIALGATIVGGLSFSLSDIANVMDSDAEIGVLVIFTSLTYLISVFVIRRRYA